MKCCHRAVSHSQMSDHSTAVTYKTRLPSIMGLSCCLRIVASEHAAMIRPLIICIKPDSEPHAFAKHDR